MSIFALYNKSGKTNGYFVRFEKYRCHLSLNHKCSEKLSYFVGVFWFESKSQVKLSIAELV